MGNGRQRSLKLLLVVQLTINFRGGVISPILALFIRRHGLSVAQIGLLGTASMLGWLFFEPLSGVISNRFRKKYMIVFALATSTVVYFLYPLADSVLHFAVLAFSMSSVMSFCAISIKALMAELLPESERGRTFGRYLSVISVGGVVAPLLGGYISEAVGHSVPFYMAAGIGVVGLLAALLMEHNGVLKRKGSSVEEAHKVSRLWTRPFIKILVIRTLFMFNLLYRQHFLPIYLHESPYFGASESEIGVYMTIVRVTSALSKAFRDLTDRVGSRAIMASSVGLIGFSYLGLVYLSGVVPLYMLGALQGVLIPAADMSMMIHLMEIMPERRTGMVMGVYSEAENVGGMVASPSLGLIYDGVGSTVSVFSVSGILIFTGVLSAVVIREKSKGGDSRG
ncbi:MAG: MFS transporter [Candidatus Bathyarchaeia archaeon]